MRKPIVIAFVAVAVAGVALLGILAAAERRTLAFTLGVPSFAAVAQLRPGARVCQQPVPVSAPFDAVELHLGTYGRPGPRMTVTVAREAGGAPLGTGTLEAGYADNLRKLVLVGTVPDGGYATVCVRNDGARTVALYGGPDVTARSSTALIDGRPTGSDLDLVFRTESRSTLSVLPDMFARASLFRAGWIGPWLYWVLLVAVLVAVPALLLRALGEAVDDDDER